MIKLRNILIIFTFALILSGCTQQEEETVFDNSGTNIPVNTNESSSSEDEKKDNQQEENMENENTQPQENKTVILKTSKGDIKLELFLEKMPITARNFLKLAESNFYDGVTFHRVIPNFMIQGGDPLSKDDNPANDGTGGPGYFIEDEFHSEFTNEPGTIAMANAGPNTGGSQFFINVANNDFLDSKHPVFGKILEGMDVVESIVSVEKDARDRPLENVVIESIVIE
jgi:peptidylprolyl isomerase